MSAGSVPARAPGPLGYRGRPRLLAGLDPAGATMTLAEHEAVHGPMPRLRVRP